MRWLFRHVSLVPALAPRSPTGGITMAKNKNRERKQPQTARAQQTAQHPSAEPQTEQHGPQITPGDVARKGREKRFGHN
ncbi:hypothetical protein SHIRM173S_07583 [Streptomyces hirsutus]